MKSLIINADDFGPCPFINTGILRAAEKGLLTSVSAMVTFGDSCHDAILDLQKKHGSQIGIGLHLSITAGMPVYKPLSAVSSLCDQRDGSKFFRSFRELELKKIKPEEVYKELEAQVELMGAILGGIDKIDHIDVHHGVLNFYDPFWKELRKILTKYQLPYRCPLSSKQAGRLPDIYKREVLPIERYAIEQAIGSELTAKPSMAILAAGSGKKDMQRRRKDLKDNQIYTPHYFIAQYYGWPSVNNLDQTIKLIREDEVVELMLHLGYGNDDIHAPHGIDKGYYKSRFLELYYLEQSNLMSRLKRNKITPVRYKEIVPA